MTRSANSLTYSPSGPSLWVPWYIGLYGLCWLKDIVLKLQLKPEGRGKNKASKSGGLEGLKGPEAIAWGTVETAKAQSAGVSRYMHTYCEYVGSLWGGGGGGGEGRNRISVNPGRFFFSFVTGVCIILAGLS